MNESPAGPTTIFDASGNGTDGSDNGTISAAGLGGSNARNFNNTSDRIVIADNGVSPLDISGSITISFALFITNLNSGPDILTKGDYLNGYSIWSPANGSIQFQINNDALGAPAGSISNSTLAYLTFTRNSSGDRVIYVDGAEVASDNSNESFSIDDEDLFLSTASFWPMTGIMDEVRISNTARDSAWIATEFANIDNPGPGGFIDQVNAEPIIDDIEGSTLAYNSGDSPTAISSTITTYDGDDTDIENASIQITSNYDPTEDVLDFVDQLGITGSWNAVTGTLTLTGTATVAEYQTALRAVTYENTDPAPVETTRTVTFIINDGDDDSNTQTRNISVTKVNNAPVLSAIETSDILHFAGNGQKTITNSVLLVDTDDANIDSAFVEISSGFIAGEDTLYFVDQNGITGSWNNTSGTLTLTGTTTKANYQTALRSVTYENLSGSPTMSDRTIGFTANDGTEDGNTVTRDVVYPTSITELASYKATGVFHFDAQDADGDGDSGTNQPANGALTTWGDRSDDVSASSVDLSFSANNASEEALLNSSYFGNRSGILFDGVDDYFERTTDNAILNTSTFTEKSFAFVIRTGASTAGFQIFYEQGGGTRGYNFSVFDGVLYAHAYNRSGGSSWGAPDGGHRPLNLGSVLPNTSYIIIANHDNNTWEASINGAAVVQVTNANSMTSHTGNAAIGAADGNTRDPISFSNTSGVAFDGFIGELVS